MTRLERSFQDHEPRHRAALWQRLQQRLHKQRDEGLYREVAATYVDPEDCRYVIRHGKRLLNLAANDYLGLSHHPRVIEAAECAAAAHGVGAGASSLICGYTGLHEQLCRRFASFKHADAAAFFPTGYMANLAVLTALPQRGDLILLDKLCHASLIDAARASAADMRTFAHLDYERLETLLQKHAPRTVSSTTVSAAVSTIFIVTDSVFSMDGDVADLPRLIELADRFDAVLIVDEAHATGVLGEHGAGLAEVQGVSSLLAERGVIVSTASKALGSLGGIVTGNTILIEALTNFARSLIYTTAPTPVQAGCILAALDVVSDEPALRERLAAIATRIRDEAAARDLLPATLSADSPATPIVPLIVGEAARAVELAAHLAAAGFFAPAIRPPTVAPGQARVRLSLRADMAEAQVDQLVGLIHAL